MHRFFGQPTNKPTLDESIGKQEERQKAIEDRIRSLDQQLSQLKPKMHIPSQKQRAVQLLQQKRQYEQQLQQMMSVHMNMTNTQFHVQSLQDTKTLVDGLKTANSQMKRQMRQVNVNKIADLQDELQDLMEDSNEIQAILGQSYDIPMDDAELELELQQIEDTALEDLIVPTESIAKDIPDPIPGDIENPVNAS